MSSSSGPPYMPQIAQVGGVPTVAIDVPISACLIFVYICLAATHMTIFQLNRKREHKFVFSAMLFGFSVARTAALSMRIAWATHQTNVSIAIAASILTQAGVIVIFIANLFFAQRIVRAYHATFGWHKASRIVFRSLVGCVVACLVMVIVCTVQSFYTLDAGIRSKDRDVQLTAGVFLAFLAFVPAPAVTIAALIPSSKRVEKFGQGRFRTKIALLIFTSLLLALGAGFRIGTNFAPRAANNPAWYHSRACYYCFNYAIEIIVSALYAAVRFDRRFHIPNGAKGPGDYAKGAQLRVNTEAETFGQDDSADDETVVGSPSAEIITKEQNKEMV
ncbi:hypothetical protein BKA67DRAFT_590859 [Truncatella angustata]|uniref:Family c-likeg--coupled receptor protein n=1 Tax=Truncatella angustata TaxID=152316 RepID=A0A9P9A1S1_9PEZI|nr:uncharacterized protein BKA67DRAFT_590859 [Truncatella angustata]KAH6657245.1 hypothetical protein BKA67DRAFT_590859 [Truncatella angustata]